jgi:hypothetical protein
VAAWFYKQLPSWRHYGLTNRCYRRGSRPRDINQLAKLVVDLATGSAEDRDVSEDQNKNPAAVQLGRLGGSKGGKARARKLSAERRTEIARKAAQARYGKRD